ncbi:hypothetical protein [Mycobacterium sp. ZZG]
MHVVLGLSLSSTSAVWVLVDTRDGSILADEVVALDRSDEIASAAARSVQSFSLRSDRDIDAVRLVWDDDDPVARKHGIRLRTKLRLFGFDNIEAVTEEAAREGRNRTARHIAPHMVLAYGAARAAANDDDTGVLRRIADKLPHREPAGMPVMPSIVERVGDRARAAVAAIPGGVAGRAAAAALVAMVGGLVGYALLSTGTPSHETPDTVAAEAVLPAPPAAVVLPAPAAVPAVPEAAPPVVAAAPAPVPVPEAPVELEPEYAWVPEPVAADEVTVTPDVPDALAAEVPTPTSMPTVHAINPAAPQPVSTMIGVPHLSGAGPVTGPAQAVAAPVVPAAPVTTAPVPAAPPAPPAPAGPLGALFRALP